MKKEKLLRIDLFFGGIIEIILVSILIEFQIIDYSIGFGLLIGAIGLIYASSVSRKVLRWE